MFNGIKNSFNGAKHTTKNAANNISDMAKELYKADWKKMPLIGWGYIAIGVIAFLIIIFVLIPMVN